MKNKEYTNFNMKITVIQKEIMDFVAEVIHKSDYSKASLVMKYFKEEACGYIGFGEGMNLSDEMLLSLLIKKKKEEDFRLIKFVGVEQYEKMIEEYEEEYGKEKATDLKELLADYKKEMSGDE